MVDYKKIMDKQIEKLDKTVKRQDIETKKESSLVDKVLDFTVNKVFTGEDENYVKNGAKTVTLTGFAYGVGVLLPVISGAALATPVLVLYGGKKFVYDPIKKKRAKKKTLSLEE